jgi:hypothetical protein
MIVKAIRCFGAVGLIAAATVSHAQAGWGCGAYNGSGSVGRSWSGSTEDDARRVAMEQCDTVRRQYKEDASCHVESCRNNVDTRDDARTLWPTR